MYGLIIIFVNRYKHTTGTKYNNVFFGTDISRKMFICCCRKTIQMSNVIQPGPRNKCIREVIDIDDNLKINVHPKSEEDVECIKTAIAANEFLESILRGDILDEIINVMYPQEIEDGGTIIQQGDPGTHLYVSSFGTFNVYVASVLVNTFNDQRIFGELALLYNNKRMATIKAASPGKVWVLERKILQQTLIKDAVKYSEETLFFLKKVPLVNNLNHSKLNKMASLLKKEFFSTDSVIVKEGDEGDKFYIVRAGSVTVTKEGKGKVAELGRGSFFGESALAYTDKRQATVTADAPGVECLTLTRSEFLEHFDEQILEQSTIETPQKVTTPINSATREYSEIELTDLQTVSTLGVGGFGGVELVQHRANKNLTFAIKYLKKVDVVKQGLVEQVFNDKNILIDCNSIFIVRMYKTFQDKKYLYYLMESCLGGDLWTYLQKQNHKSVPDHDARFYAACVLEALAYLHERNTIYRDMKPGNLLIDAQGYLKLTDFVFAKCLGTEARTFTFVGSPASMAPEMIFNKGHDTSVDYWSFGILIYELLAGGTPFHVHDDHMKIYSRILKGINSVQFPDCVSRSAKDIILKLCRAVPTERLGAQKNGVQDIRDHKWFQGFDWNKLRNKKLKAPFVPKLSSSTDTKYFPVFKKDADIPPDELSGFDSF